MYSKRLACLFVMLAYSLSYLTCSASRMQGFIENQSPSISYLNQEKYHIRVEDTITFIYTYTNGSKETFTKINILPNGMLIIPGLGESRVVGKTSGEVRACAQDALKATVSQIVVLVNVTPKNISVLGAVKNPGSYGHADIETVYDAIAKAGGFSDTALRTEVGLIRQKLDGTRISYTINFPREVFEAYNPGSGIGEELYILQEGDLIFVPTSKLKQFGKFMLQALNIASLGAVTGLFSGIIANAIND